LERLSPRRKTTQGDPREVSLFSQNTFIPAPNLGFAGALPARLDIRGLWPYPQFKTPIGILLTEGKSGDAGHRPSVLRQARQSVDIRLLSPGTALKLSWPIDLALLIHALIQQRNLKRNGGLLDEVQFFVHTEDEEDLKWLDDTVEKTPGYRKIVNEESNFGTAYDEVRRGVLYIKIDDDVVSATGLLRA
jgi:hypothetical protein